MKKKEDKQKDLEALRQDLEKSRNLFVTGYEKMRVSQDFELRKTVRAAGGKYRVVKNNMAEKASEGTPSAEVLKDLRGMTSLAYTTADPVALAKALTTYAKTIRASPSRRAWSKAGSSISRPSPNWPTCLRRKRSFPSCST